MRRVRRELGEPKREDFARTLAVSKDALALYERGENVPAANVLAEYRIKFGVDINWLLTGEGEMFADPSKRPAAAPVPAIDADLFRAVGRLILKVYKDEGVKLPPEALLDEQSGAYNALIARAEDPRDITELTALLPWLEARLRKSLAAAAAEPGSGKHAG
ncbi:helix-turn-helix domain-containing protein [Pannonibacter sp. SL95]|uniref:helix-turn-helix domain-containing protein n=1 Tax=Pannonibacter sp. SL95 TaxID=2995153 RepID=UPI002273F941|nr:helix-turn-helix transcriptional regulator [Pannonibacter sp. SL95]MCY1705522.1 helix-turn-helix transcriptional regulator [Pannonibacter sp. SL95]